MMIRRDEMKDILKKVLDEDSSFSFEMKVLQELRTWNFYCEHSGLYTDPITKVNREFDIRAWLKPKAGWHICLGVECKNISAEVPLVIHSTSIPLKERTHSLIINHSHISSYTAREKRRQERNTYVPIMGTIYPRDRAFNFQVQHRIKEGGNVFPSLYSKFEFVGRSMDKLKIKSKGGPDKSYHFDDGEIYAKFSQAQNSIVDLIEDAFCDEFEDIPHQFFVLPILVVPDGTLWEQKYLDDGQRHGDPEPAERIPLYVNKTYHKELHDHTPDFFLRFVEIVTFSGLKKLLEQMLVHDDGYDYDVFLSNEDVAEAVKKDRSID